MSNEDFLALLDEHGLQHNKQATMGLTEDAAREILRQTQPAGTRANAAGAGTPGPDVKYLDANTGEVVETVQVKAVSSARGFENEIKSELKQPNPLRSRVIAVQVLEGAEAEQLMGRLRSNFGDYDTANRQIIVVDPFGKVVIPLQPWPKKGG